MSSSVRASAGRSAVPKGIRPDAAADAAEVRRAFRRLFDAWDSETFLFSFPHQIYEHWAYEELVGLGEAAIPYMLGEVQRGRPNLVVALRSITGESPVKASEPNTEQVMAAWVAWGEAKGYVPTIA